MALENGTWLASLCGSTRARDDMRAPIFYDNNDTGYYGNFASDRDTNINGFTARTVEATKGTWKYNIPRYIHTGNSDYWVGTMGWGTTDFNTMMTWGSGFIDSWSSPANAPSGTSHWVGTQAYHYTNAYNSAYGWQMVGGPIGNLRFRQSWPNAGTWRTVPMLDVNDGNGGAMYAGIYYDSDNTGYYSNPAGTSNYNGLTVAGVISGTAQNSQHLNTTRDTPSNSLQYWQASGLGSTEAPTGDWHNTIRMGHGSPLSYYSNTLAVRMTGSGPGDIYTQCIQNGTAQGWKRHWNNGGDNSSAYRIDVPIVYDYDDTAYYFDGRGTTRMSVSATNSTYFGSDVNKGYAQGYGTWSSSLHKIAYISFDWNATYDTYSNHGISSTDLNGSFTDSMSINSFNDINLRLDANNNNANSYIRIHDNTTGNATNVGYIGSESGNHIAYFGNRVYAAIYYDHDTGYYGDFRSTSRMNTINADYLYSYNWVYAQGDVIAYYSDERLKTKVGSIENALDKISKLNGFYYVENDLAKSFGYKNEKRQLGLSAQEVKEVLPEIVTLAAFDIKLDNDKNVVGSKSGEDYLTVNYGKIVPLLIEGIKEQTEIIKSQQKQIDELKEMIQSLIK
jgi:hypothetical protein